MCIQGTAILLERVYYMYLDKCFHVIRKGELWMIEQRSESGVKWDYKLICARCRASQQHLFPSSLLFQLLPPFLPPLSYIYPHLLYDYQSATLSCLHSTFRAYFHLLRKLSFVPGGKRSQAIPKPITLLTTQPTLAMVRLQQWNNRQHSFLCFLIRT